MDDPKKVTEAIVKLKAGKISAWDTSAIQMIARDILRRIEHLETHNPRPGS